MQVKKPDTKYDLEEYLVKRKSNAEKSPRAPSGFMKKHAEQKEPRTKPER